MTHNAAANLGHSAKQEIGQVRKSGRVGLRAQIPVGKRGATLVSANMSKHSICSVPPGMPVGRVGPRGGGRPTVMLNPYQSESDRYGLLHDGYKNVVRVENMSLRKKAFSQYVSIS